MTVSGDKLQFILENSLEESIPLVKRGIFTPAQLQDIMSKRQKYEKGMLKMEYKITDYLAALEYQYSLERLRKFRMDELTKVENGNINPAYKKQSSSDFAIIKRIIRIWDRTMHKYKFRVDIWKQYLAFCVALNSKKHFYKALTKALRFLPFQVELWKVGVEYQKQYGHNYWKARKILLKGLKMIPAGLRNLELGKYMVEFQLEFVRELQKRTGIMVKKEKNNGGMMNFINPDGKIQQQVESQELNLAEQQANDQDSDADYDEKNQKQMSSINLNNYDEVIYLIIEQIITKNTKTNDNSLSSDKIIKQIYHILNTSFIDNQHDAFMRDIITKIKAKLNSFNHQSNDLSQLKVQIEQEDQNQFGIVKIQKYKDNKLHQFQSILNEDGINFKEAEIFIKKYCLKVTESQRLFQFLVSADFVGLIIYLSKSRFMVKVPNNTLSLFLQKYLANSHSSSLEQKSKQIIQKYLINQIDKKVEASDYKKNPQFLRNVLKYNSYEGRYQSTTKIMRSLAVHFKKQPQFLQICNKICNSFNKS